MKPNIDLTLNRDFRDRVALGGNSYIYKHKKLQALVNGDKSGKPIVKRVYQWNYKKQMDLSSKAIDSPILTGNASERSFKREVQEYNECIGICERCGEDIKFPWKRRGLLCAECDAQLFEEVKGRVFSKIKPWNVWR